MKIFYGLRAKISALSLSTGIFAATLGIENAAAQKLPPPISWEEMEKLEPLELGREINTMNLYERLDLATLTPLQVAALTGRLKKMCRVVPGYRIVPRTHEVKMLVQLRDEETITRLLSQMGKWQWRIGRCR